MLAPKTRICALPAIVTIALFCAGCGSPRTAVDRRAALDDAIACYVDGDLERAEALFTKIVSDGRGDEDNVTAYLYLGRIYLARGDYERAADAFSAGRTLGGDIRFTEYYEEAQRHLTASPQRIIQLPHVTRGQLAALIETMFGQRLQGLGDSTGAGPSDSTAGENTGAPAGTGATAAVAKDPAIDFVVGTGVMPLLPDGEFHEADRVTRPAFFAVVRRLGGALGAESVLVCALFPGGLRGTVERERKASDGEGAYDPFVSGREVHRVLDALARAVHSGDE